MSGVKAAVAMAALVATGLVGGAAGVGIATASIDLGNEWIKIGLVKPGVPMDIVLNTDSKRKTEVIIGIKDEERTFGRAAVVTATKHPKYAFMYITELLGQQADSKVVDEYKIRFPEHTIVPDPTRGTVTFQVGEKAYTVEELLAQIIDYCVKCASDFAEQEINAITITVPVYFTQAQRKALLLVGDLAGVKVLQLLNANTAVAVNYGVFRLSKFNETTQNIMYYDMGASSTIATIVSYNTVVEKKGKKPTPQVAIKAVAYDRTLGGVEWTYRLRDHLMKQFLDYKKVKGRDVTKNERAMHKLFFAAQKTKTVLSANQKTQCRVEGLFDEIDFKQDISREELEVMTTDLYDRVATPAIDALKFAGMEAEDLDQVIMFGGGWRMPKVQTILKETLKVDKLGMSINSDEAACLGASFKAATLTKSFRTPAFKIQDASVFPVQLQYNKPNGTETKRTKVNLYSRLNPMPQKKIFRFKNMSSDFIFDIGYGNVSFLDQDSQDKFGKHEISSHNLTGVADSFKGHENDTDLGIKVHVEMDISGLVSVDRAYTVFEREVLPEPEPEPEKSTIESVADAMGLGGLFGNGTNGTNATAADADADADADAEGEKDAPKGEDKEDKEEEPKKAEDKKAEEDEAPKKADADVNATGANATGANATDAEEPVETPPPPPPKPIQLKEFLVVKTEVVDLLPQTDEELAAAHGRIQDLIDLETERVNQAAALNDLESRIYKIRDRMEEDKAQKVTNESQREVITANLSTAQEWLDDEGWEANTTTLNGKLNALNGAVKDIFYRVAELTGRPKAVKRLKASLNSTSQLVDRVRKMNNESVAKNETLWITEREIDGLAVLQAETQAWLKNRTALQQETVPTENPVLKIADIKGKTDKLDREQLYLAKRPKPRPKKPKVPKNKTKVNGTGANGTATGSNETVIDNDNATVTDDEIEQGSGDKAAEGAGDEAPQADADADAKADEGDDSKANADADADADADAKKAEEKDEL